MVQCNKLLFTYFFFHLCCFGFSQQSSFSNYSIEQGLSQSVVNCIFQDSKGFIWFGTQHGLNKFNGFTFETYTFSPTDTNSISNNWIYAMDEDKAGNLWVVTKGGLNKFVRGTGRFIRFQFKTGHKKELNDYAYDVLILRNGKILLNMTPSLVIYDPEKNDPVRVSSKIEYDGSVKDNRIPVIEDKSGIIWIGSTRGLSSYNPGNGKFTYFFHDPKRQGSLSNNNVTALFEDRTGHIWIGTSDGLNVYDKSSGTIREYTSKSKDAFALSSNFIRAITEDPSGNIWIGTEGGGLNKLINPAGKQAIFENFTSEKEGLSQNIVLALKIDQSENLWIGTLNGISKTDLKPHKFKLYRNCDSPYSVNLLGNVIASIFKDDSGNIWVGNWGQGLNIIHAKTGEVEHFASRLLKNHRLPNDFIHVIYKDLENRIWIGTRDGILIYKKETNSFVRFKEFFRSPDLPDFLGVRINKIIQDHKGNYWIATQNGLYRVDLTGSTFERFYKESAEDHRLCGNLVYSVLEDRDGMIWIATLNGLDLYNPASGKMTHYQKVQGSANSLSDNFVISLCEDHNGNIWIGTGSSVNAFMKKDSVFVCFSQKEGLPNDQVFEILEDNGRHLWFATGSGLSRFDSTKGTFRTYSVEEGLQSLEFNLRASFKSRDGEIFFGGMNGFNSFFPDSLYDNKFIPAIAFTSFTKTTRKGSNEQIDPETLHEVVLNYDDYSFTIEFAALEFTHPEKNRYAYMMEGIADKWIDIGTRRFVPFANLPPGDYNFKVKASNNDGVWNEAGISLRITIQPPWWKSYFAFGFYILSFILLLVLYVKWRTRKLTRERNQLEIKVEERTRLIKEQKDALIQSQGELDLINKELEHRVEERTAEYLLAKEKAESGDRLKSAFMHNISHEIRTPLNGILGFGQLILEENISPEERKRYAEILQRSSMRLMNTVTDYMDISLIASGNMEVNKKPFEPVVLLSDIHGRYFKLANSKNLTLTMVPPPFTGRLFVNSDYELLSKVLDHLVENAIKFTRQGGVSFGFVVKGDEVEFMVSDSGIGIDMKDRDLVFEDFSQADALNIRAHEGSGLGLSIAKGIVELVGGRIWFESVKGEGTTLFFTVPIECAMTEDPKEIT